MRAFILFLLLLPVLSFSQNPPTIIRGFSPIGSITTSAGGAIKVEARETINPVSGGKSYGIAIVFKQGSAVYIEYQSIEYVLKGLEYFSGVDKSVTKLETYEVSYRITEALELIAYSTDNGNMFLIIRGIINDSSASIRKADIPQLISLVVKAKERIDSIK